ncbi:DUF3114 domain-containing protein [Limosilactobacillus caccae]|uniref:DUF3114 domain-containing protein n=1 Tax=Limosilactobacillus caccae TaxID=1926284 RepID=UPI0013563675|nr:DUF3114 domain-containing protein [Limosilactobacillus caccae]
MRELNQVGSPAYLTMLRHSGLTAAAQLDLIINHHLHAFIDHDHFLQLPPGDYILAPTLTPLSSFYPYFRDLVVAAYHTPAGLKADELGQKIHLFRSYLDRQNINFIRHYRTETISANATDLHRLCQYAIDHHLRLDLKTAAGFHNRYHDQFTYPRNMKVQLTRNSYRLRRNPARMIEFIIDIDTGNFVSQWNVYHHRSNGLIDGSPAHYSIHQLYQVANTESFNYGIPAGGHLVLSKYRHTHQWLDISQPPNSKIRRAAKKYWHYPHDLHAGGEYADLVKSFADVLAWRRVPCDWRQPVYSAYQQYLTDKWHRNRGINKYLKRSPYRQFAIITDKKR